MPPFLQTFFLITITFLTTSLRAEDWIHLFPPEGYGFQFEAKIADTTDNPSKPILDKIALTFEKAK